MVQYCDECKHFENPTYEDWFDGDYHMWTEINCSKGNKIDDLVVPYTPFDKPCPDYEEE